MTDRPPLLKAFDALERRAAGPLEGLVRATAFADALTMMTKVRRRMGADLERQSRRALHAWNLPAASDVARLNRRIAALENELRRLNEERERR